MGCTNGKATTSTMTFLTEISARDVVCRLRRRHNQPHSTHGSTSSVSRIRVKQSDPHGHVRSTIHAVGANTGVSYTHTNVRMRWHGAATWHAVGPHVEHICCVRLDSACQLLGSCGLGRWEDILANGLWRMHTCWVPLSAEP